VFENIIGHGPTTTVLRDEVVAGRLPRAVLLSGPAYSGKLSIALELARVLACARTGTWGCECGPCLRHRDLSFPYLLLMGWRYWEVEIRAAAELLQRSQSAASYHFFVRAVRKLTRRYDRLLWEGEETRLRPAVGPVSELNDLLEGLDPGLTGTALEKRCAKIETQVGKLVATIKTDNVAIGQIRNVERWLHLSAPESRKVVILEHAEGIQESSRNALLRLLEEPPAGVHLILLTRRSDALIATLRSRLREYALRERSSRQQGEVLRRIFRREQETPSSLRDYFLTWQEFGAESLSVQVTRFLAAVTDPPPSGQRWIAGPPGGYAHAAGLPERLERERLLAFLEQLSEELRTQLRQGRPPALLQSWAWQVDQCVARMTALRIQPRHALQGLGSALRAAAGPAPATGERT
jgi:DNA polymerase-3 subunit gamma/tau